MTIENKNISSNQSLFDGFPNGVYSPIKNADGKDGFVSRRFGQEEIIPIAEGKDIEEAKIIVNSYHNLRLNPHEEVEDTYIEFVCRKTKELSQPEVKK